MERFVDAAGLFVSNRFPKAPPVRTIRRGKDQPKGSGLGSRDIPIMQGIEKGTPFSPGEVRVSRLREELRRRGMSIAEFARSARCSRQYAWQVLRGTVPVSDHLLGRLERILAETIDWAEQPATTGMRLRRARRRAGYTLKETAAMIGYTWIAVQRWERDVCLPKPGVLLHLCQVYGEDPSWIPLSGRHNATLPQSAAHNN
jgi:transcriptional regulator with XRE-family HTH domain